MSTGLKQTFFVNFDDDPGCSITVVRMHGVHVARVQFPAPRHLKTRACSSSGRAPHSHCGGKGFESPQVHKSGCGIKAIIHASGACDPSSILGSPTI